jgi:hypothetical protein
MSAIRGFFPSAKGLPNLKFLFGPEPNYCEKNLAPTFRPVNAPAGLVVAIVSPAIYHGSRLAGRFVHDIHRVDLYDENRVAGNVRPDFRPDFLSSNRNVHGISTSEFVKNRPSRECIRGFDFRRG